MIGGHHGRVVGNTEVSSGAGQSQNSGMPMIRPELGDCLSDILDARIGDLSSSERDCQREARFRDQSTRKRENAFALRQPSCVTFGNIMTGNTQWSHDARPEG
jgi:hypothetical protein